MLAQLMIDHVTRFGRRIVAKWQVDAAAVLFRLAPAQCGVGLFGFTIMELTGQLTVRISVAGKHDKPGGFPVQAVHDARFGIAIFLQTGY